MNKSAQIIPVKGLPIITKWNLIWLKSKKLSPTAKAFLEYLKSEKEQEIKANFNWIEAY
jgi:ABC-type molybdate transport system substrate-binding protein